MEASDEISIILEPANDVTDLDEWYAALEAIAPVRTGAPWSPHGDGVAARVPQEQAVAIAQAARQALGAAVLVRGDVAGVAALDIATGQPVPPPTETLVED